MSVSDTKYDYLSWLAERAGMDAKPKALQVSYPSRPEQYPSIARLPMRHLQSAAVTWDSWDSWDEGKGVPLLQLNSHSGGPYSAGHEYTSSTVVPMALPCTNHAGLAPPPHHKTHLQPACHRLRLRSQQHHKRVVTEGPKLKSAMSAPKLPRNQPLHGEGRNVKQNKCC
jgi:hypothetical protein